jgi:hypothetical protein
VIVNGAIGPCTPWGSREKKSGSTGKVLLEGSLRAGNARGILCFLIVGWEWWIRVVFRSGEVEYWIDVVFVSIGASNRFIEYLQDKVGDALEVKLGDD